MENAALQRFARFVDKDCFHHHPVVAVIAFLNQGYASSVKAAHNSINASGKVCVLATEVRVCGAFEGWAKSLLCLY
jgi:hypothetical protein